LEIILISDQFFSSKFVIQYPATFAETIRKLYTRSLGKQSSIDIGKYQNLNNTKCIWMWVGGWVERMLHYEC